MLGWSFQQQTKQLNLGSTVSEAVNLFTNESKVWIKVQYTDKIVVVNKPKPEKVGNSLQEKTQVTLGKVSMIMITQKVVMDAKDRRNSKSIQELEQGNPNVLERRLISSQSV